MTIAELIHSLAVEGMESLLAPPAEPPRPSAVWAPIRATGTRLWLDTGDMDEAARLWNEHFEALTTNNTLLNKEVQKGIYDELITDAARKLRQADPAVDEPTLRLEIAFLLNARHGLRLVRRFNAFVSVELHTDLAHDVERTVAYGRRLHAICPERFIVKVPLTPAGLVGARRLVEAGVPVNFTLGFSARQNVISALVARPNYVNVFMGRLNAFVADNKLGDGKNIGEKATLATQRAVRALRESGRTSSRLIGASMREGAQVGALAGVDVFTMPPAVAAQYQAAPWSSVLDRTQDDPAVATAPGIALSDFAGATLWETPDSLVACAEELAQLDAHRLTPATIVDALRKAGHGDVFPEWSQQDVRQSTTEGKIPVFAQWKSRLADGSIGLDALMNLAAFCSFTKDQAALDARILQHVER